MIFLSFGRSHKHCGVHCAERCAGRWSRSVCFTAPSTGNRLMAVGDTTTTPQLPLSPCHSCETMFRPVWCEAYLHDMIVPCVMVSRYGHKHVHNISSFPYCRNWYKNIILNHNKLRRLVINRARIFWKCICAYANAYFEGFCRYCIF
jgi:hypothetical protein